MDKEFDTLLEDGSLSFEEEGEEVITPSRNKHLKSTIEGEDNVQV